MQQKKILILGSTGSIGTQTLDIVRCFPEKFCLVGALVLKNTNLLQQQVDEFLLDSVCIIHEEKAKEFSRNNPKRKVYSGQNGALQMIQESDVELVVLSVVGEAGVVLAKEVLQHKKNLALATKEVIVSDGREILQIAKKHNTQIFPIDSEHSAIWQCLHSGKKKEVEKIWLTCSGGPFRDPVQWPKEKLKNATISDALCHPNWKMGKKISIDSATLMNKALELIEAVRLFHISHEKIEVVVHPESHLHSAIEFRDGSIIGQIGTHDMRIPIAYALFYPDRAPLPFPKFSFFGKTFQFHEVDQERFPSLFYARKAIEKNVCQEFNHANEKAVQDFLEEKIGFLDIFTQVKKTVLS